MGAHLAALVSGDSRSTSRALTFVGLAAFGLLLTVVVAVVSIFESQQAGVGVGDGSGLPAGAQPFLAIYQDAANVYKVNPFLLMAVHEDETSFSTSTARGVRTGVNYAGCCAGPMQFYIAGGASPAVGGRGATWAGYASAYTQAKLARPARYPSRIDRPHPNVYDSYDAIYAAAKYFRELGAGPKLDQRTFQALASYKGTPPWSYQYARADYNRARELEQIAQANGGMSITPGFGNNVVKLPAADPWLVGVPGFPGRRCDARILPNLTALVRKYNLDVRDCFALTGHAADGEHPLGVGVDIWPNSAKGGTWAQVDALARWAEPAQNQPRPPFRWVGYNGDANHGSGHHLHLSWDHAPAAYNTQPSWVLVAR